MHRMMVKKITAIIIATIAKKTVEHGFRIYGCWS
jgi:hypothetical protein